MPPKAQPAKRRPTKPVERVNLPNLPVPMRLTPLKRPATSDNRSGSKSSPVVIDSDSDSSSDASVKEIERPSHPTKRCRFSEVKIKQEAAQNNDKEATLKTPRTRVVMSAQASSLTKKATQSSRKSTPTGVVSDIATPERMKSLSRLHYGQKKNLSAVFRSVQKLPAQRQGATQSPATSLSTPTPSAPLPSIMTESTKAMTSLHSPSSNVDHMVFSNSSSGSAPKRVPTQDANFTGHSLQEVKDNIQASRHVQANGKHEGYFDADDEASNTGSVEGNDAFEDDGRDTVAQMTIDSVTKRRPNRVFAKDCSDPQATQVFPNVPSIAQPASVIVPRIARTATPKDLTIPIINFTQETGSMQGQQQEQEIHEVEPVHGDLGEEAEDIDEDKDPKGEEEKDEDETHEDEDEKEKKQREEQDEIERETEDETEDEEEEQKQHQEDKEDEDVDATEKEIKALLKKKQRVEEKLTKIEYRIVKLMRMQRVKQQELREKAMQAQREHMQAEQQIQMQIQMQIQQQVQFQEQIQSKTQTKSKKPDLESQLRAAIDESHTTPRGTPRMAPPVAQHRVRTSSKSVSGPAKPKRLSMASSSLVSPTPLAKHGAVATPDDKANSTDAAPKRTSEVSGSPYGKLSPQRYRLFADHLTSLIISGTLFGNSRREEALFKCCTAVNKLMHKKMKKGKATAGSKSEEKFSLREVSAAFVYLAKKAKVVLKGEGVRLVEGEW